MQRSKEIIKALHGTNSAKERLNRVLKIEGLDGEAKEHIQGSLVHIEESQSVLKQEFAGCARSTSGNEAMVLDLITAFVLQNHEKKDFCPTHLEDYYKRAFIDLSGFIDKMLIASNGNEEIEYSNKANIYARIING